MTIAIYPREGTETVLSDLRAFTSSTIAIYPREGTETFTSILIRRLLNCNLSPRGDGNAFPVPSTSFPRWDCNLSPRGDGNHIGHGVAVSHHAHIAIYPREGTETRAIMMVVVLDWLLQFIPARGRKRTNAEAMVNIVNIAIYPREGTETQQSGQT